MSEFKFVRPLDAPVFCPTEKEFEDPLAYLNKIRPQAERAGICKIKPPSNWTPPFAVDVDSFKFTPRIQRLNELEAKTRIKLNFLDQIAKFWELQGSRLKIPMIDKSALDLYTLHKLIQAEGGHCKLNNEKKWNRLATRMGYASEKNYGSLLKGYYEKILYPFDLFQTNELNGVGLDKEPQIFGRKGSPMKTKLPASPVKAKSAPARTPSKMGGKQKPPPEPEFEDNDGTGIEFASKELRRLAFYGAGPKMAGFNSKSSQNLQLNPKEQDGNNGTGINGKKTKFQAVHDPLARYICLRCKKGDSEDCMLLCDGCDDSYHTFCLLPPLAEVPKGEWRCPQCVAEEVSKPSEAFGFEQAQREYTLQQFGEMADKFKCEYFNKPLHRIDSEVIEREFWRIVSAIDEDVTVEYGADLHTMDHGSGFPTEGSNNILPGDEVYTKSGWNLNNLPVLPGSVLGHINADISGMKVPWMYVGMCFSTFCWHNEDHWSYSINYLHWGEPKTWYGVPGSRADDFENAMKQAAPELFESQPDLLHQLVTIMNPNILMKAGVPVFRMDQMAGEFVVTFPRAYHAGFNQGYNFAEAVNFAPPDWLAMGRNCVEHYSTLHRYCVFAHDELVCKMSTEAEKLTLLVAMATYQDLLTMLEAEREQRRVVNVWGITKSERKPYELLPDDERLCDYCKTTCFLSAVVCTCTKKLSCLRHYDKLCECPPSSHTLMYRYTLDEIPAMMGKLKGRTDEYNEWVKHVEKAFGSEGDDRIDIEELRDILLEAETKGYPKTPLRESALRALDEAEKCIVLAQRLTNPAVKTRHRNINESRIKITVTELQMFANQMGNLEVQLKESIIIRQLLAKVRDFKIRTKQLLADDQPSIDQLKACLNDGEEMQVELEEISMIQSCLDRTKWIAQVDDAIDTDCILTLEYLNKAIETGRRLEKMSQVETRLIKLENTRDYLLTLENKAKHLIANVKQCKIYDFEKLIKDAKHLNVALPSLPAVRNLLKQANDYLVNLNKEKEMTFSELKEASRKRRIIGKDDDIIIYDEEDDDDSGDRRKSLRNSGSNSKPPKQPRNSLENKKPNRRRRKTGDNSKNEEYNEDCAALPCLQPAGTQVHWVQCDAGCEGWFHLACLGMQKNQVDEMEHFECDRCKRGSKKNKSSLNEGEEMSDENSRDFDCGARNSEEMSVGSSNKENAGIQKSSNNSDIKMEEEDSDDDSDKGKKSAPWFDDQPHDVQSPKKENTNESSSNNNIHQPLNSTDNDEHKSVVTIDENQVTLTVSSDKDDDKDLTYHSGEEEVKPSFSSSSLNVEDSSKEPEPLTTSLSECS